VVRHLLPRTLDDTTFCPLLKHKHETSPTELSIGRMKTYDDAVRKWEADIEAAWREEQFGLDHGGGKSYGPWHAKLNDTMFWM
jgi:hypothetical protein